MKLTEIKTVERLIIPPLTACGPIPSLGLAKSTFAAGIDRNLLSLIDITSSGESFDLNYDLQKKLVFLPAESRFRANINLGKTHTSQEIIINEITQNFNGKIIKPGDFYAFSPNVNPLDISLSFRRIVYFVRAYPDLFQTSEMISLFPFFGLPEISIVKIWKKNNGLCAARYLEDEGIPMTWVPNIYHRFFSVKDVQSTPHL